VRPKDGRSLLSPLPHHHPDCPQPGITFFAKARASGSFLGGPFFLEVKYDHARLKGTSAPIVPVGSNLTHYDFTTLLNGSTVASDPNGIDLRRKD
jgi:hypothetical protein